MASHSMRSCFSLYYSAVSVLDSILYVFGDLPIVLLGVSELDISSHILLPSGRVPILFERALLINYGSVYQYTHHKIHNYCDF